MANISRFQPCVLLCPVVTSEDGAFSSKTVWWEEFCQFHLIDSEAEPWRNSMLHPGLYISSIPEVEFEPLGYVLPLNFTASKIQHWPVGIWNYNHRGQFKKPLHSENKGVTCFTLFLLLNLCKRKKTSNREVPWRLMMQGPWAPKPTWMCYQKWRPAGVCNFASSR